MQLAFCFFLRLDISHYNQNSQLFLMLDYMSIINIDLHHCSYMYMQILPLRYMQQSKKFFLLGLKLHVFDKVGLHSNKLKTFCFANAYLYLHVFSIQFLFLKTFNLPVYKCESRDNLRFCLIVLLLLLLLFLSCKSVVNMLLISLDSIV